MALRGRRLLISLSRVGMCSTTTVYLLADAQLTRVEGGPEWTGSYLRRLPAPVRGGIFGFGGCRTGLCGGCSAVAGCAFGSGDRWACSRASSPSLLRSARPQRSGRSPRPQSYPYAILYSEHQSTKPIVQLGLNNPVILRAPLINRSKMVPE